MSAISFGPVTVEKTDFPIVCQLLELLALFLAGRGGTLLRIEAFPVAAETGDMGTAGIAHDGQGQHGIGMGTDSLRHLVEAA